MKSIRIDTNKAPDATIQAIAARDAVLWVGPSLDTSDEAIAALKPLIELPWRLVLCESNSPSLLRALEDQTGNDHMRRVRGFLHIVAADPENLQLPPRSLPVYLLRGRPGSTDPDESDKLKGNAGLRRRLNMVNEAATAKPQELVVVSSGEVEPLDSVFTLWEESFRARLTVFSTHARDADRLEKWMTNAEGAPSITCCGGALRSWCEDIIERLSIDLPDSRLIARIRQYPKGMVRDVDFTNAELPEHPVLDRYELLQSKELRLIQPSELTKKDFAGFFDRSQETWKPYAAGLPWPRSSKSVEKVLKALQSVEENGAQDNQLCYLPSESGAGGTTLAHVIAFEAASRGYPTLVARQVAFRPQALEIASFLHRALQEIVAITPRGSDGLDQPSPVAKLDEVPWLLVFDIVHWEARESELRQFIVHLTASGRSAVVLWVSPSTLPIELRSSGRTQQLPLLGHELEEDQVLRLGHHLNRFLQHYGRAKTDAQWRSFWESHHPNIQTTVSAFWIALEFWLKGQLSLTDSIQAWLNRTFKEADFSDELRLLLLEIAALSVERQPMPEGLMPSPSKGQYPFSVQLDIARIEAPALALVRESTATQKHWAMAHDLLGRYLLAGVLWDRSLLERLNLHDASDAVHLRLKLLRQIACRTALARPQFSPLALEFASKILKLDADGNPEFIPYWREVLSILDAMPAGVRETSRTFNHHVAVSRRRVAKHKEFSLSLAERREQLELAIRGLEYALFTLPRTLGEESNLNLFNSLALAYQDLADVERESGAEKERIEALRAKATEATLNALSEDPINPFVLETTAKNLIQNGELYPEKAASNASEALGYIYQALALERSEFRQHELSRLANRALKILRNAVGSSEIDSLCRKGNPLGFLAAAWLELTNGIEEIHGYTLTELPSVNINRALQIIESTEHRSQWMLLRFKYDLVCASAPRDFATQVQILDELLGTSYQMPLQLQLEYAILLHEVNRHPEANKRFKELRSDLVASDATIEVPNRLRWLYAADGTKRICEAQVVEHLGERSRAKIRELKDVVAPFLPQEFGERQMPPGSRFTCTINFGRRGPFIKRP